MKVLRQYGSRYGNMPSEENAAVCSCGKNAAPALLPRQNTPRHMTARDKAKSSPSPSTG